MEGTQKKMKLSRKFITHSSFAVSLFVRYKKIATNNKKLLNSYICHSGYPNYCKIVVFNFRSVGEGEGWFEADST